MGTGSKQKENVHVGHRARLRRRFVEEGLDAFEDHQVPELLLFFAFSRRDTNELAHLLLRRYGSFASVLEADPLDLAGDDTFVNQWQTYPTRKDRSLAIETPAHTYQKAGEYQILVKVVDISGNDTSHMVKWRVR